MIEHLTVLHFVGRLLPLPTNIELAYKNMQLNSALAYLNSMSVTRTKSLITLKSGAFTIKHCRFVMYWKTDKLCCKLVSFVVMVIHFH
jgi:hypothetical protein